MVCTFRGGGRGWSGAGVAGLHRPAGAGIGGRGAAWLWAVAVGGVAPGLAPVSGFHYWVGQLVKFMLLMIFSCKKWNCVI